jgi:hypothetical protein
LWPLLKQPPEPQVITVQLFILHQQPDEFVMGQRRLPGVGEPFLEAPRHTE